MASTDLQTTSPNLPSTEHALTDRAREYVSASMAENTKRAYSTDWTAFSAWCEAQGVEALPASSMTLVLYLTSLAEGGKSVSTIDRALTSISQAHKSAGFPSPRETEVVRACRRGIARTHGSPAKKAAPLVGSTLRSIVERLPTGLLGLRDRALLLVGFLGAFRESEIVGLDVDDLEFKPEGVLVTLRRSKTDQEAQGVFVALPKGHGSTCPVEAIKAWLDAAKLTEGPLFRSINRHGTMGDRLGIRSIDDIVKRSVVLVGLDSSGFSGHSLRAGLATSAIKAGKSEASSMKQTRHRSVSVFRQYVRVASAFDDNAAHGLL